MINTGKYHDATAISPRLSFEPIQFVKKPLKTVVIVVHNCEFVIATIIEISIGSLTITSIIKIIMIFTIVDRNFPIAENLN